MSILLANTTTLFVISFAAIPSKLRIAQMAFIEYWNLVLGIPSLNTSSHVIMHIAKII